MNETRWYHHPATTPRIKGALVQTRYGNGSPILMIRAPRATLEKAEHDHNLKRRHPIIGDP